MYIYVWWYIIHWTNSFFFFIYLLKNKIQKPFIIILTYTQKIYAMAKKRSIFSSTTDCGVCGGFIKFYLYFPVYTYIFVYMCVWHVYINIRKSMATYLHLIIFSIDCTWAFILSSQRKAFTSFFLQSLHILNREYSCWAFWFVESLPRFVVDIPTRCKN